MERTLSVEENGAILKIDLCMYVRLRQSNTL